MRSYKHLCWKLLGCAASQTISDWQTFWFSFLVEGWTRCSNCKSHLVDMMEVPITPSPILHWKTKLAKTGAAKLEIFWRRMRIGSFPIHSTVENEQKWQTVTGRSLFRFWPFLWIRIQRLVPSAVPASKNILWFIQNESLSYVKMKNYTQFIKDTFSVQLFNLGKKITPAPLVVLVTNIRFDTRYQHYDVSKFELALLWIKICTILSKRFMW